MKKGDGVAREDVAGAARTCEPSAEVVGGVLGGKGVEGESPMDARREGSIAPYAKPVVEVAQPGHTVYIMGPKPVAGEHVDGKLVTPAPPSGGDPLAPDTYDGATLPSPAVDYNYDITTYRFSTPGQRRVSWEMPPLKSNVLVLEVGSGPANAGP